MKFPKYNNKIRISNPFVYLLFLLLLACETPVKHDDSVNRIEWFEHTHQKLSEFKDDEDIEGLAFAIFDRNDIILDTCFGHSTYGNKVNDKTLFSLQSISKNVTALAGMLAVQDSLLDLDVPISKYLPEFTVNSCFEDQPERTITLRMLLSHTAGFTHEAPVGNNYDYLEYSFEEHLESIGKTWLKFPAGTQYSYSNLGFDLAAKIIEEKSGVEFKEYLKSKVFNPIGMTLTTIDDKEVLANDNKTEGSISYTKPKHFTIPLMGSGAVYSNLNDMVKYVQLQMNHGKVNNDTLIQKDKLFEMYKINRNNYGLGTYIDNIDSLLYMNHNGSGYGYSATMLWYPEYEIGSVLLCNKQVNTYAICERIMANYVSNFWLAKNDDIGRELHTINAKTFDSLNNTDALKMVFCTNDTIYKDRWKSYTGTYALKFKGLDGKWYARLAISLGYKPQKIKIKKVGNTLKLETNYGESLLREYKPGIFFTNDGEVLNLNPPNPTFRNIELEN